MQGVSLTIFALHERVSQGTLLHRCLKATFNNYMKSYLPREPQ